MKYHKACISPKWNNSCLKENVEKCRWSTQVVENTCNCKKIMNMMDECWAEYPPQVISMTRTNKQYNWICIKHHSLHVREEISVQQISWKKRKIGNPGWDEEEEQTLICIVLLLLINHLHWDACMLFLKGFQIPEVWTWVTWLRLESDLSHKFDYLRLHNIMKDLQLNLNYYTNEPWLLLDLSLLTWKYLRFNCMFLKSATWINIFSSSSESANVDAFHSL